MAKKENMSSPAPPAALKKQASSSSKNGSILSFFSKAPNGTPNSATGVWKPNSEVKSGSDVSKPILPVKKPTFKKTLGKTTTPVPSSDVVGPPSSQENEDEQTPREVIFHDMLAIVTSTNMIVAQQNKSTLVMGSSPSRKVTQSKVLFIKWRC